MIRKPRLLLTGASGLFGATAANYFRNQFDTVGVYLSRKIDIENVKMIRTDLRNSQSLVQMLSEVKPEIIIHAAALVNVDRCESNPEECYLTNVRPVEIISNYCEKNNVKLIFLSTDAFFDLPGRKMASEKDTPTPISQYGESKLEAEKIISEVNSNAVIVRTNIYGWRPYSDSLSLAEWMLDALINRKPLKLVHDVYYTPIFTKSLSRDLHSLIDKKASGVFHLGGAENISKLEFGHKLASIFGLSTDVIQPISVDDLPLKAKRSKNMALSADKFRSLCPGMMGSVNDDLISFRKLIVESNSNQRRTENLPQYYLE